MQVGAYWIANKYSNALKVHMDGGLKLFLIPVLAAVDSFGTLPITPSGHRV